MSISILSDLDVMNIFFQAIEEPVTLPPRADEIRLVLNQVCVRWRRLILDNPVIWAYINFLPKPVRRPDHLKEITKLWLSRGERAGLNLNFKEEIESDGEHQEKPTLAYELLFAHGMVDTVDFILIPFGSDIISLKWTVCTERAIKSFLSIPRGTFQRLESIQLKFFNEFYRHETYFSQDELQSFSVFQGLPNLRNATIRILNGINPLRLKFPLRGITRLDIGNTTISPLSFMTIIHRSAPSLIQGYFNVAFKRYSKYDADRPEIFRACGKYLQTLHLRLVDPSKDDRMFDLLTLPSIRELRIDLQDSICGWKPSLISKILRKSSATLETLILSDFPAVSSFTDNSSRQRNTHHTEIEQLFKSVPNLRALCLAFGLYIHSVTLEKIATGDLLPHLTVLSLSSLSGPHVLSAVRRRNELAIYLARHPGSSFMLKFNPMCPSVFSNIIIAVPGEDREEMTCEIQTLQRISLLKDTKIDIVGDEVYSLR